MPKVAQVGYPSWGPFYAADTYTVGVNIREWTCTQLMRGVDGTSLPFRPTSPVPSRCTGKVLFDMALLCVTKEVDIPKVADETYTKTL